jgi:hypothetical protein
VLLRICQTDDFRIPYRSRYSSVVEDAVGDLLPYIKRVAGGSSDVRWLAMRRLEGDVECLRRAVALLADVEQEGE